jgi:hypothetical protein
MKFSMAFSRRSRRGRTPRALYRDRRAPGEGFQWLPALAPHGDKPRVAEQLHVVRERRLRNVELGEELAGAALAVREHAEHGDALFIAEGAAERREIGILQGRLLIDR